MGLDMSGSSIGVSREGMIRVKEGIRLDLIEASIQSMNGNVETLKSNVDNYWHGASAEAFKLKIDSEKSKVVTILKVLEAKMELDLGVMATNSAIADAEVAMAIFGLGGSGGGSSTGGSTGGVNGTNTQSPSNNTQQNPPQAIDQDPSVEDPNSTPEADNKEADDIDVDGPGDGGNTPPQDDPLPIQSYTEEDVMNGDPVDISGIEYGRVSSDAQEVVKLLQQAGHDVSFLREVTLRDGTVMWAFNQSNGLGYAWFKKDEILEYLNNNN